MGLSIWQLAIVAILILILFGRGRISEMMGDFGKGIKSFKQGINEEDAPQDKPAQRIEGPANGASDTSATAGEARPVERDDSAQ